MHTQPLIPFDFVSRDDGIYVQVLNFDTFTINENVAIDFGSEVLQGVVVEANNTSILVKVGI
jgi:hypothetical protein